MKKYNVFKIKDLNSLQITSRYGGEVGLAEPELIKEGDEGNGLIIWSYTDRRNLPQETIDNLSTRSIR